MKKLKNLEWNSLDSDQRDYLEHLIEMLNNNSKMKYEKSKDIQTIQRILKEHSYGLHDRRYLNNNVKHLYDKMKTNAHTVEVFDLSTKQELFLTKLIKQQTDTTHMIPMPMSSRKLNRIRNILNLCMYQSTDIKLLNELEKYYLKTIRIKL